MSSCIGKCDILLILMHLLKWYLPLIIFRELFPSSIDRYATVKVVNGTKSGFFYWRNYNHSMNLMIIGNDCCRRIWSEVSEILVIGDHWRFATSTGQRLNKIWAMQQCVRNIITIRVVSHKNSKKCRIARFYSLVQECWRYSKNTKKSTTKKNKNPLFRH